MAPSTLRQTGCSATSPPQADAAVRIGLITPCFEFGGAQRWLISLVQQCDSARLQWAGMAVLHGGWTEPELGLEMARRMAIHEGPPHRYAPKQRCDFVKRHASAREAIREACNDADVIIAWGVFDLGGLIAGLDVPTILVTQNETPWDCAVAKSSCHGATHLVAVSQSCKKVFEPAVQQKVTVIYNGADPDRCVPIVGRNEQRRLWAVEPHHKLIGYVGRQNSEKNPIAAARAVAELGGDYRAAYVGDGRDAQQLRAEALRVAPGRCLFVPPVSHVGDVLAALDVFLLASSWEGSSLGLFEAWLAEIPTVCTPIGAIPELHKEYGSLTILVPINPSPLDLAEGARRALDPANRETIAKARQVTWNRFTASAMAEQWTAYIESLARPHPM